MIDPISRARQKKTRLVVGLMSGTSADGIDACLCQIEGFGTQTRIQARQLTSIDYPAAISDLLISKIGHLNVEEVARLNFLVAKFFSQAALECISEAGLKPSDIDAIASHGQTLIHLPDTKHSLMPIASTLQVGDISVIAQLTGILTIGDFRPADMAQGGQGAPLVPYVDYLLFRDDRLGRIVQNIGGIGNLTYLPPGCSIDQVIAFDTGPGNMIIDAIVTILSEGKSVMDKDGRLAFSGNVNHEFLSYLLSNEYYAKPPPKSTGRELFGIQYAKLILEKYKDYVHRHQEQWDPLPYFSDIVATVSQLTVQSMATAYRSWVLSEGPIDQVILGGGGALNPYFVQGLKLSLMKSNPNVEILSHIDLGIADKAKEALAFAVLGNDLIGGIPNNLPTATGAQKPVIMGKVAFP